MEFEDFLDWLLPALELRLSTTPERRTRPAEAEDRPPPPTRRPVRTPVDAVGAGPVGRDHPVVADLPVPASS